MSIEQTVGKILTKKRLTIAVAESCTGGLVSNRLTDVSGSSKYFMAGFVAYSNGSKESWLGISHETLKRYGAVSREVALDMARGIMHFACADIGIGITGIAGPTGGTKSKPVGLVYIAFVKRRPGNAIRYTLNAKRYLFKGSRKEIKFRASEAALEIIRRNI